MSSEFLKKQQNVPMIYRRHGDTTPKTKSHTLGDTKPLGHYARELTTKSDQPSLASPTATSSKPFVPAFITTDKKVLRFEAYFLETVNESESENYRVRRCTVLYYLEDDSIQILEPKVPNSGLPQGNFIKRHKIPKSESSSDIEFFSYHDLRVASCISCYGRTFRLVNADAFTRTFLAEQGIEVAEAEAFPTDTFFDLAAKNFRDPNAVQFYGKKQNNMKIFMEASLGKFIRPSDHLRRFIEHDRHVCRWYAVWDDTERLYGMKHRYTVHYFLSDNTVEIREDFDRNSGCDPWPKLLNRTRLVKNPKLSSPHATDDGNATTDLDESEYYSWQDFTLGTIIHVYGRNFKLLDVDASTREWFEAHDIVLGDAIEDREVPPPRPAFVPPPHTGIGSEEDSLNSCFNLTPKPPRANPECFDATALRFSAVMETSKPEDKGRHFIVSYHVSDKSLGVMEPPVRNSGIVGGKFLERGKHKKPDGKPYAKVDFFMGARVPICGHMFLLTGVDEATVKHMEVHADASYPKSDAQQILNVLSDSLAVGAYRLEFQELMDGVSSSCDFSQLKAIISRFFPHVVDHQVNTLLRKYAQDNTEPSRVDVQRFQQDVLANATVRHSNLSEMAKHLTERQQELVQACRLQDGALTARLDRHAFGRALTKLNLPTVDICMLTEYFYPADATNAVDYNDILATLGQLSMDAGL